MGMRHQIYLAYNQSEHKNGKTRNFTKVVGIHHQWLYGRIAAQMATRMMQLLTEDNIRYNKESLLDMLRAVYCCIPEEGYFAKVHTLEDGETEDPRRGDNDCGITIFDCRNADPAYCFMFLQAKKHYKSNVGNELINIPPLRPICGITYMENEYPNNRSAHWWQYSLKNLQSTVARREAGLRIARTLNEIKSLSKKISPYQVMTLQSCKQIFPAMYRRPRKPKQPRIQPARAERSINL